MTDETTMPQSVLDLIEMSPVEDLLLGLLPSKLPDVKFNTLIEPEQAFPFVLIRCGGSWGNWAGDQRFLDAAQVEVHTFAVGVNADEDAAKLAEAIRVILRDSVNVVVPQRGHITDIQMTSRPTRVTDWSTSSGPVQYANLPSGVYRYQTEYHLIIRKPSSKPFSTP